MNLDQFWEFVFSEDAEKVHIAWDWLDNSERVSVRDHLEQIVNDMERIEVQRVAAQFALQVIAVPPFILPEGALEFARDLAHQTGDRLKFASGQLIASTKRDGTLVTTSDIDTDRRVADAIKARYPDHGILSEEAEKVFVAKSGAG